MAQDQEKGDQALSYADMIPAAFDEAVDLLLRLLLDSGCDMEQLRGMGRANFARFHHHGLGRKVRNDWELWSMPPTALRIDMWRRFGLWHPDDISGMILEALWCRTHVDTRAFDAEREAAHYRRHWAGMGARPPKDFLEAVAPNGAMTVYLFHREGSFYPLELLNDEEAVAQARLNPGTLRVENAHNGKIVWESAEHVS